MGISERKINRSFTASTHGKVEIQIDRGYVVGIIFIDFQKAFNTVSHDILFHRLIAAGISGNLHEWIVDYLSNRVQ